MLKKNLPLLLIPGLLFLAFLIGTKIGNINVQSDAMAGSKEKFEYLTTQRSNVCARITQEQLASYSDDARLQGSCCSPMDLHRYQEQIEGLKKYRNVTKIPQDPYDIPVTLAKELLGYKDSIKLTEEQQKVYDGAMKLSEEGGPCCCRCWRWDAFEGLAKYLITQHNFTAEQVAEIWDLEDGCGGVGHEHG